MSKHSYAGSTKLPESDMASSCDDNHSDMETEVSSRRSKSMSWSQKTMAQKAKQIKRAMVKQGKMTEEEVLKLTKEEVMALRCQAVGTEQCVLSDRSTHGGALRCRRAGMWIRLQR